MKQYDIAIIGGGMAGATLAVALQNTGFHTLLIDATPLQSGTDHRLIALAHNSCNVFKNLNLWPELSAHAAAIKKIHVSKRGQFGSTEINAHDAGLSALGHLIPAKAINAALNDRLATLKNFTQLRPAKLIALTQHSDEVELAIDHDGELEYCRAKIVIGADGTQSTVRNLVNITTETFDYQQKALVTQVDLQRDHHHVAYERFLSAGAIAMLPLAEKKVAVIWSDNNAQIDALLKLSDAEFLQTLQQQFGFRLGKFVRVHQRAFYPLQFVKATEQSKGRVILIGNAAHTMHPVASQGLNLTLHEIAVLVEKLSAQSELIVPQLDDLQQQVSMNLSHRLTQLFSADFFVVNTARQMGLFGMDVLTGVKKLFIARAMGNAGAVPELCRADVC